MKKPLISELNMSYDQLVMDYLDSHRDEIISFMQRLIQIRSVTGDESEIGWLLGEECSKDGLEAEIVEPAENRTSVVARYKGTTGEPRVMVYSHIDTVPPGDPDQWKHPPFSATIADGQMWGRGAADNKIATCAVTMAFRAIRNLGIRLKGDIVFAHVADEEKGGVYGFRNILDEGYAEGVDYLFYGHGGSREHIGIAANGSVSVVITVKGRAAHTRSLEDGINAVVKAAELIGRFGGLADEVNSRIYRLPGTDTVMRSRFSVNKCSGYVATNCVPDRCEVIIDRRVTPAEDILRVEEEIHRVLEEFRADDPEFDAEMSFDPRMDVSVSPADSEIVRSFQRAAERVVGFTPKPRGGSHSSDHGYFVTKHGRPVASYGIGGVGTHMANEHIAVEDIILTTKVYALTMLDLLGAE
jgi:acetylornithine deacetylase/succinyl-diaminopimelate desuccinylase family protein